MFGLDARIALAIFGALSVISGAALYSAIQDSKATSLIVKMNEVAKAWEQYYLDTGAELPSAEPSDNTSYKFYQLRTNYLVEDSGLPGWNGPYISYDIVASGEYLQSHEHPHIYIAVVTNEETWGETVGSWLPGICSPGKKCFKAVLISGLTNDIAQAADKKVDNGDGGDKGNFRWYYNDDLYKTRALMIFSASKNLND